MLTRTYGDAMDCLNSLQSNKAALAAIKVWGMNPHSIIPEMIEHLRRIGYTPEDLNKLNVIHVTGTKGKGSTSAFTSSILCKVKPGWKIGLYTSPHLVAVRERIRVNGRPISEEEFTKFFFEVWDSLEANPERHLPDTPAKPIYFCFVTLVALHAFYKLKVDATILEVGIGGTNDCTNIVPKPIVTGITSLGLDHQGVLGKTLPEIAWHKGGIYKEGVPAFSVIQPDDAMEVLRKRAEELKASEFAIVPATGLSDIKLGLAGVHQVLNACLAVAMAQKFLEVKESLKPELTLSKAFVEGLEQVRWPGRCQIVQDPKGWTTWFLDGAHTIESLDCCIRWFVSPGVGVPLDASQRPTRVLVFNITHHDERSGPSFLGAVDAATLDQLKLHGENEDPEMFFDHVIFCTNTIYIDDASKSDEDPLATQQELGATWSGLKPTFPSSHVHILPTIENAVHAIDRISQEAGTAGVYALVSLPLAFLVIRTIEETNYDDEQTVYADDLKAGELEAGEVATDRASDEKASIKSENAAPAA